MAGENDNPFKDFITESFMDGEPVKPKAEDTKDGKAPEKKPADKKSADKAEKDADDNADDVDDSTDTPKKVDDADDDDFEGLTPEQIERIKAREKKLANKRIAELTQIRRRQERKIAELEGTKPADTAPKDGDDKPKTAAELARALLSTDPAAPKKPDPNAKGPDGKPLYEYGEVSENYQRDLWEHFNAEKEYLTAAEASIKEEEAAAEAGASQEAELRAKYDAKVDAGSAKYDDFEEVVVKGAEGDDPKWKLSQAGMAFILDSDVGEDVAYHLASNPKEASEIAELSPVRQILRLGQIEEKFSKAAPKEATKKSAASAAPEPVKGARGSGGSHSTPEDTEDFAAFEAKVAREHSRK